MRVVLLAFLAAAGTGVSAGEPRLEKHSGRLNYGLTVIPPWPEGGKLVINLPEHLEYESRGMGILRHNDKVRRGTWEVAGDGKSASLDAESPTAPGVRVTGSAKVAGPDRVEITMRITNGGKIPLADVKPLFCHHYREIAGFPQWTDNFKHTYVVRGGKPVPLAEVGTQTADAKVKGGTVKGCRQHDNGFAERHGGLVADGVDAAITAVTDLEGKRKVVVSWTPGKSFLANASIPCLHADPFYGTIEPGKSAEAKGVVLFTEKGLDETFAGLQGDGWGAPPPKDGGTPK